MAVSSLSEAEFIGLCLMKWPDFVAKVLRYKTPRGMMELRRQMQIACTAYAKGKPILTATPGQQNFDTQNLSHLIQFKWIQKNKAIERFAREVYFQQMIPMVMRTYPDSMKRPGAAEEMARKKYDKFLQKFGYTQKAKSLVKRDWERLQKSLSY